MKSFNKITYQCLAVASICILSACTTANVEQNLPPVSPVVSQTQPSITTQPTIPNSGAVQQTAENALATPQAPTPAQNVTQGQLQPKIPSAPQVAAPQQVASLDTSRSLIFLPFEGAPPVKATSMTRLLKSTALSNGLSVLPATRAGAKYKVKGYFSALTDGKGTLLVYVWDVTDDTGKRLHRINGRERSGKTRTDPWEAISDSEIQRVANTTTRRLKAWVDKRS